MKKNALLTVEVDSQGRFVLPADVSRRYGLIPGAEIRLEEDADGLHISRSTQALSRVYVEPTNICNLDCMTCMRNVWDEAPGRMSWTVFQSILDGVRAFHPVPTVFFGGFGEPLTHPQIAEMVAQAHQCGAPVELITNGILLDETMTRRLMQAGLDRLWLSLDGATPESYADVRLGASLSTVIANLRRLKDLRGAMSDAAPRLGIAFVAMRRNIADFPALVQLGKSLGADQFVISNVLPHTPELRDEMLYKRSMNEPATVPSEWSPMIAFPRLEINELTGAPLLQVLKQRHMLTVARHVVKLGARTCPFLEKGSLSVRWDGAVSPCLALLHSHESYLDDHLRKSQAFSIGSLLERSLEDIWRDQAYVDLRERLLKFDFSPCMTCNSCEMADKNQEDCFGNDAPACGGCLWGQGFIQCP